MTTAAPVTASPSSAGSTSTSVPATAFAHGGDPQSATSDDEYARGPRRDAQVELRGSVVRDLQETFRDHGLGPVPSRCSCLPGHDSKSADHGDGRISGVQHDLAD